jgi:tRNA modification GTPase
MSKISDFSQTIVALATALGGGSIAIIRVSGNQAISTVNEIFKGKDLTKVKGNTIHFGQIFNKSKELDQILVAVFKAPHSYTGEDYVEVSCHANPYIVDESQAEAVSNIIQAKSRLGIQNALKQLDGALYAKLNKIKNKIIDLVSHLEVGLDFSEENLTTTPAGGIIKEIEAIQAEIMQLVQSFNYAKLISGGITMTIVGQPNVGKSTLMNTILGEERAITSHIPGTTRDTIHENILMDNVFFKLIDTAGLRETVDSIELEGIERTKTHVQLSDIILLVIDISQGISKSVFVLIRDLIDDYGSKIIIVANKIDLGQDSDFWNQIVKFATPCVKISAKNGTGVERLKKRIVEKIANEYEKLPDEIVITNARQKERLEKMMEHLQSARIAIKNSMGHEFVVIDLREALNVLGEITGETVTEDILNNIFSNFCIGK